MKAGAAPIRIEVDPVTALGDTPFDAVTVKLDVPSVVGVPLSTPLELRVRPVGNEPEDTAKVGWGEPVALYV